MTSFISTRSESGALCVCSAKKKCSAKIVHKINGSETNTEFLRENRLSLVFYKAPFSNISGVFFFSVESLILGQWYYLFNYSLIFLSSSTNKQQFIFHKIVFWVMISGPLLIYWLIFIYFSLWRLRPCACLVILKTGVPSACSGIPDTGAPDCFLAAVSGHCQERVNPVPQ